jgi:hypothetical protein
LSNVGFTPHFINLISDCISIPQFSVLINNQAAPYFQSQRGIRQGCPLSPYLFVLAINQLSCQLQNAMSQNHLAGISLGPGCPPLHSLMFADDLIIAGKVTTHEATKVKDILLTFCTFSRQTPNWSKSSILFSKNVHTLLRQDILHIFPIQIMSRSTTHLGHPLIFSYQDRAKAYNFLLHKFRAKITGLKANKLNHAGRITYINSILASIPIYYMQNILFPECFTNKINAILRQFWWQGVQDEDPSQPFHFRSWEDICTLHGWW